MGRILCVEPKQKQMTFEMKKKDHKEPVEGPIELFGFPSPI